jgi:hypothetical protein
MKLIIFVLLCTSNLILADDTKKYDDCRHKYIDITFGQTLQVKFSSSVIYENCELKFNFKVPKNKIGIFNIQIKQIIIQLDQKIALLNYMYMWIFIYAQTQCLVQRYVQL